MSLTFYGHPLSAFCWKVLIALHENAAPFEFNLVDLGDPEAAAAFRKLSPMGMMPALREGDLVLTETSIIIEHLDQTRPGAVRFLPDDRRQARDVRYWDRFYDLYVAVPMQRIVFDRIRPDGSHDPLSVTQARQQLATALDVAARAIEGRTWATGEAFSMADCAAAPALHYAEKVQPFGDSHPGLGAYLRRLEARPSFAAVLKAAEPYAHMFPQEPA